MESFKNWKLRVWCSLLHFFHVIGKVSNLNMWTAKYLVQASCTKLTLYIGHKTFYSIFRFCPHQRPREFCVTCPRTDTRQNPRQTENQIDHYESSYQRNHYQSTYERTSSTFQTSRNEELYRNLQDLLKLFFLLSCICVSFLIWASTQGYQNSNKRW